MDDGEFVPKLAAVRAAVCGLGEEKREESANVTVS
jgi:hypothetical protein